MQTEIYWSFYSLNLKFLLFLQIFIPHSLAARHRASLAPMCCPRMRSLVVTVSVDQWLSLFTRVIALASDPCLCLSGDCLTTRMP